jgi:hypothetical protein
MVDNDTIGSAVVVVLDTTAQDRSSFLSLGTSENPFFYFNFCFSLFYLFIFTVDSSLSPALRSIKSQSGKWHTVKLTAILVGSIGPTNFSTVILPSTYDLEGFIIRLRNIKFRGKSTIVTSAFYLQLLITPRLFSQLFFFSKNSFCLQETAKLHYFPLLRYSSADNATIDSKYHLHC